MKTIHLLALLVVLMLSCRSVQRKEEVPPIVQGEKLQIVEDDKIEEELEIADEELPALMDVVVVGYGVQKSMISAAMPEREEIVHNTEEYDRIDEQGFKDVVQNPLSTFSIDVDNAAYTNVRRYLNDNSLPPADAVRIEEMINYFDYDYAGPKDEKPFAVHLEMSDAPWHSENKLLHVGIQGKQLNYKDLQPSNLVFLIDVSGSMSDENKLPLLKKAFGLLLNELDDRDRVAIVVYASQEGLVLPSTPASDKKKILAALEGLASGGSTAGGAGIRLAYDVAAQHLLKDGNNRVILATDGDFNVGVSSTSEMVRLIEEKRQTGIYLTILGLGMGNYKDGRMEQISNAGNGNYFYIDNIREAEKVFVKEMRANLFTIAKDVKIQIEFNPLLVKSYRLIGYENRRLNAEDFDNDKKDAGELGAGHSVTALYELVPAKVGDSTNSNLKYQSTQPKSNVPTNELLNLKLRYKLPKEDESKLIETAVVQAYKPFGECSLNHRFAASVAAFGMLLRQSEHAKLNYDQVIEMATAAKGADTEGYRAEMIQLLRTAKLLQK